MTYQEWESLPWINFSDQLPELNQQVCVIWAPPYDGEADCVWDGNLDVLKGECAAVKWKPVLFEI